MIEIRIVVDAPSVHSALGSAFAMLEEVGEKPTEVTVREVRS